MRPLLIASVIFAMAGVCAELAEPYRIRDTVSDCVHVRSEPDTEAESIACLPARTSLIVVNTAPYWREVILENGQHELHVAIQCAEAKRAELLASQSAARRAAQVLTFLPRAADA